MSRSAPALIAALAVLLAACASRPAPLPPAETEVDEPVDVATRESMAPEPGPSAGANSAPERDAASAPSSPALESAVPPRIADGATLFRRMAEGFEGPVCVRGEHNRRWRQRYAAHPRAMEDKLRRALPLMAWVVEQIERRELPMHFALIPIVESGYRPDARGPGGPTGLWQMISSTARNHGVQVGGGYDGRLSPVDSTAAALDYLATLHAEFGDWRATAMAYNAGEGRLRRAFARAGERRVSGERRLPPGLSEITYAYIAKLHALACLIAEPGRHGLSLPSNAFAPLDVTEAPPGLRNLDAVARRWSLDPATLRALNPSHRNGIAARGAPRRLLHPRLEDHNAFAATAHTATDGSEAGASERTRTTATAREHMVRRGDTLWELARRYGTTVRAIASANGLRADRPLRLGTVLRIPD